MGTELLERRYRRLLWAYPPAYRTARADELTGTLLDAAPPDRHWPTALDATDLAVAGLRERLRRPLAAGAEAGLVIAAPYARGLAGCLALFAWLVIEPAPAGYATFGPYLTVAPIAYAGWLLALAVHSVLPGRWARRSTVAATALTAGLVPLSVLIGAARPPLWVLAALLCLGALSLLGDAGRVPSGTQRVAVPAGAALAAALAKNLLLAWPAGTRPATGYYQPSLYLIGLVFGAVVVALGLTGLGSALTGLGLTGRPATRRAGSLRPWLWAALLIALPGSWLGPGPLTGWTAGGSGPGFGRLAEVLTGTVVVLAAMAWLVPNRDRQSAAPGGLARAGATAVGVGAGIAVVLAVLAGAASPGYRLLAGGWLVALLLTAAQARSARIAAALVGLAATGAAAVLATPGSPLPGTGPGGSAGSHATPIGAGTGATFVLLGLVALAGAPVRDGRLPRGYPLVVGLGTALAALGLAVYDADWRLARPTTGYPALVLTLAVLPFALAAAAGLGSLRARATTYRATGLLALGCGLAWLGALALPSLPTWGPVLLTVALGGAVLAARRLRVR